MSSNHSAVLNGGLRDFNLRVVSILLKVSQHVNTHVRRKICEAVGQKDQSLKAKVSHLTRRLYRYSATIIEENLLL